MKTLQIEWGLTIELRASNEGADGGRRHAYGRRAGRFPNRDDRNQLHVKLMAWRSQHSYIDDLSWNLISTCSQRRSSVSGQLMKQTGERRSWSGPSGSSPPRDKRERLCNRIHRMHSTAIEAMYSGILVDLAYNCAPLPPTPYSAAVK